MLPALLLAYPEITALTTAVLSFIGIKKFRDLHKDDISNLFGDNSGVVKISNDWSDDTKSTKPMPNVISLPDSGGDVISANSSNDDNVVPDLSSVVDVGKYIVSNLKSLDNSDVSVPDLASSLKSVSISLPKVDENVDDDVDENTLIGLLKSNNIALRKTIDADFLKVLQVLGVIANSVSAMSVSTPIALGKIANEVSLLKEAFFSVALAILSLANRPVVVRNIVDTPNVTVENNVETPSVNFNLEELVNTLNDRLSPVAESHKSIKDYYDFLKKPVSYNIEDIANSVPDISPREAMAINNLVNAHLSSQEATLSAEDLGLDDYDIDLGDVIAKLFNFEGISKDIEKFKEDDNGS